ncbi:feruloyl-CoA synthase [Bradyrhizobium japonicum]|uniref:AMP-binding protein n=1 Tax=Bradyrhizobium TaxID=374 RepID=UPI0003F5B451|nr:MULTISPECIES: AMP-binding protein [Bradyrhizobium]MCP1743908.1 feruloyl-CoA synthase [Bradyrhizobium japonicum]MCP1861623.1 feruloyl-CoA synthase [Bradyrhizobium japonicum]MCP1892382.1 feruloyl-CoA synthase [Bradyrhizobium japonicum]MCW2325505.1 feruloyl-CoA synthase [Bradyrhizobium japonicum]MDI2077149.1 AMP-binding protein [Bradyrhizobium sp. Mp27]
MIDLGAKRGDRLASLSGNSIEQAIVTFAAMSVGVVVAPITPNYSLMPGGLARLQDIAALLRPSFVFVQNSETFSAARKIPELASATWIIADQKAGSVSVHSLYLKSPGPEFERAFRSIDIEAAAKILFTFGSTGLPKGVINTHKMMASSLQMGALLVSPREAPVQVEWLPWHHTMGSKVILHGILKHGGTLYIDDGRPVPQLFHKTIANLKDVSPTAMFNVPAGYTLLCEALEADQDLRANFFQQLDRVSYAGAAISRTTLDKLYQLAKASTGRFIPVMAGYGTTETAPTIATTHWATDTPDELGLPAPGVELKLIPAGDTFEARVRDPNVTPGYLGRPDLTSAAFDEEGFYRVGDTISFIDPANPSRGLRFTGRVSENFKLANGTWVAVGNLRAAALAATHGVLQDVVIAGENRQSCAVLTWLNPVMARQHAANADGNLNCDPGVIAFLQQCLRTYNTSVGSSERICAFTLLDEPPSLAAGEITDKAYIDQRAVLTNRAAQMELIYSSEPCGQVIVI